MSTYEQWAAFSARSDGTACVTQEYKGYMLRAIANPLASGFAMQVCIGRQVDGGFHEAVQIPDWPAQRFAEREAALAALLDYGRDIIDGKVSGSDVSWLLG